MGDEEMKCDSCKRQNVLKQASLWCRQCCDKLCETCVQFHNSNRLCLDHNVEKLQRNGASKSNYDHSEMACGSHLDQHVEQYCFDHKVSCCPQCVREKHQDCQYLFPVWECSAVINKDEEVSNLRQQFTKLKHDWKDECNKIDLDKNYFQSQCVEAKTLARKQTEAAIKHIREKESMLFHNLCNIENDTENIFKNKQNDARNKINEIRRCLGTLDSLNESNDQNPPTVLQIKKLQKDHDKYKRLLEAKTRRDRCDVRLAINPALLNLESSLTSFGNLKTINYRLGKTDFLHDKFGFEKCISIKHTDCTLSDIEVVDKDYFVTLCYETKSVFLYSIDGSLLATHRLHGQGWTLTKLGPHKVAVSIRNKDAIEIVSISVEGQPKMSREKIIRLTVSPSAISYTGTEFVVFSDDLLSHVDMDGMILHQFNLSGIASFGFCAHEQGRILYTDPNSSCKLYCLQKEEKYSYAFELIPHKISRPVGVTYDADGNIYLVGHSSHNVFQYAPDGTFVRKLIHNDFSVKFPYGVRVAIIGGTPRLLLVGGRNIWVYKFGE